MVPLRGLIIEWTFQKSRTGPPFPISPYGLAQRVDQLPQVLHGPRDRHYIAAYAGDIGRIGQVY